MAIDIDGVTFEELLALSQRIVARLKFLVSMQAHLGFSLAGFEIESSNSSYSRAQSTLDIGLLGTEAE